MEELLTPVEWSGQTLVYAISSFLSWGVKHNFENFILLGCTGEVVVIVVPRGIKNVS